MRTSPTDPPSLYDLPLLHAATARSREYLTMNKLELNKLSFQYPQRRLTIGVAYFIQSVVEADNTKQKTLINKKATNTKPVPKQNLWKIRAFEVHSRR